MDIPEALEAISESIDEIESQLSTAEDEARNASSHAYDAKGSAEEAETQADYCIGSIEEAQGSLSTLRDEYQELVERIDEDSQGEESGSASSLQKDIARHKVKVLNLKKKGHSVKTIAKHLEIGEFLVSRILELEDSQVA
jgi:chromosome segregation ATPase